MKLSYKIVLTALILMAGSLAVSLNRTVKETQMDIPGFTPVKDDQFAAKYAPRVLRNEKYGNPFALYYRASKNESGNIHVTYHYIWEREVNLGSGWRPFMSRWLYTGGLGIQKITFGKGDIEQVSLIVNPRGEVIQLLFETAESYSDSDFGVRHKTIKLDGKFRNHQVFDVISWNHLFRLMENDEFELKDKLLPLRTPSYFTEALWQGYTMVKREEKLLSKNRAHLPYEREYVE